MDYEIRDIPTRMRKRQRDKMRADLLEEALHYLSGICVGAYCKCYREHNYDEEESKRGLLHALAYLLEVDPGYQLDIHLAVEAVLNNSADEINSLWDLLTDRRFKEDLE